MLPAIRGAAFRPWDSAARIPKEATSGLRKQRGDLAVLLLPDVLQPALDRAAEFRIVLVIAETEFGGIGTALTRTVTTGTVPQRNCQNVGAPPG